MMLPIRDHECSGKAAATLSVYDRRGRRLGTVYLGRMPAESGQETLSRQLTALLVAVLRAWDGTIAAVGLHHRWGIPTDAVFPPGARPGCAIPVIPVSGWSGNG